MKFVLLAMIAICAVGYCTAAITDANFGQSYCVSRSNAYTGYKYIIPGRGTSFFIEILGPNEDFCFQFDFPNTNPVPGSTACLPESFFFLNFRVLNNANPTFNIVFRYGYNPASLAARSVPEDSIRLLLFRNGVFGRFINNAQVDTNADFITQSSSSLTDIYNMEDNFIGVYAGIGNCPVPTNMNPNRCGFGLQVCGNHCYSPSTYTCFDNSFLCPVGLMRCGQACYNTNQYSCNGGQLVPVQQNNLQ